MEIFSFDEITETIDAYVHCIRQVTTLLLEVFKNTLPTRLYCVLFPLVELPLAVETSKNFNKEENRQTISGTVILHTIHGHMGGT